MNIPKKDIMEFRYDMDKFGFFDARLVYHVIDEINTLGPDELGDFESKDEEAQEQEIFDIIPDIQNEKAYNFIQEEMTYWCREIILEKLLRVNLIKETFGLKIDEGNFFYRGDSTYYDETFILNLEIIDMEKFKQGFEKYKYDVEMFFGSIQKEQSGSFMHYPRNYDTFCQGINDDVYGEILPYENWGEVLKYIISSNDKFLQDGSGYMMTNESRIGQLSIELDIERIFDDYIDIQYQHEDAIFEYLVSDIMSILRMEYSPQ
jgi:hypothetical protein